MNAIPDETQPQDPPAASGPGRNFYGRAMTRKERRMLGHAQTMEGLSDEIALLRVRLSSAAQGRPEDLRLVMQGIGLLVRAVAAQHRLSPSDKQQLTDQMLASIRQLTEQFNSGPTDEN